VQRWQFANLSAGGTEAVHGWFDNLPGSLMVVVSVFTLAGNVWALGEVADIEAQIFNFVQKFNRRITVEFSTKPAILPNCC